MNERTSLGRVASDEFDRFIDLVVAWVSSDAVRIRVNPATLGPFDIVSLKFDENDISSQLEEHQLPTTCVAQLRFYVPLMLYGILSGQRNNVTRLIADHEDSDNGSGLDIDQVRNEISTRTQVVEEKIVSAELKRQYAIKSSANNPVLLESSWEVLEKKNTDGGLPLSGLMFANLRIQIQKPSRGAGLESHFVFDSPRVDSVTITMTIEDLLDLSESVEGLMSAMKQAIQSESEL